MVTFLNSQKHKQVAQEKLSMALNSQARNTSLLKHPFFLNLSIPKDVEA